MSISHRSYSLSCNILVCSKLYFFSPITCAFFTGNIRVFCRIRPFLPGENQKQTIVDYVGENGELAIVNPVKQGKDGQRVFKFNKVFSQAATQGF